MARLRKREEAEDEDAAEEEEEEEEEEVLEEEDIVMVVMVDTVFIIVELSRIYIIHKEVNIMFMVLFFMEELYHKTIILE